MLTDVELVDLWLLQEAGAFGGPEQETDLDRLLARAVRFGTAGLGRILHQCLSRVLRDGPSAILTQGRLLSDTELQELTDVLATLRSVGDLFARGFLRDYQAAEHDRFGEPLEVAAGVEEDLGSEAPLITPEAALRYFLGLYPMLGIDPQRYGEDQRRQAFTLAVATDTELLGKVQGIIGTMIESGQAVRDTYKTINQILSEAGVTPASSGYVEMVVRTNFMESANQGAWEEMRQPDLQETFPVWKYSAVVDSRSRPEHAAHDGKYYSSGTPFSQIRGTDIGSIANCRCTFIAVSKWRWKKLEAQGVRLAV